MGGFAGSDTMQGRSSKREPMSRGNRRRPVFEDERDCQRLLQGLEQTVGQFGWHLLSFVIMPDHVHRLPITKNRP